MKQLFGGVSMSLRMKVGGVILLTTLIAVVLSLSLSTVHEARSQRLALAQARASDAELLAANLSASLVFDDPASARTILDSIRRVSSVRDVYVLDKDGRVFVAHGPHRAELLVAALESRQGLNVLETRAPIMVHRERVGELVLITGLGDMRGSLVRNALTSALLSLIAIVIALVAGSRMIEVVVGPVRRLSAACARVRTAGDFSERVERTGSDELGQLTDEFNALFETLGENDGVLRQNMLDLTKARDAAEAANIAKSQFLANMSHEVRTPLNGVLGMVHVMQATAVDDVQRDQLATIRQSSETLLQVLNDVLDFSKIEAGKLEVRPADFVLEDVVTGVSGMFAEAAAAKGLQWSWELADGAPGTWFGDAVRLRQILMNLLSNGLKFTERGQVSLVVTTTDEGLAFAVSDTGIGITAEQLPQLFSKFSQVDASNTRRAGGTGLGLVISRDLAQLLGGTIEVASNAGRGSTFIARIPLRKVSDTVTAAPSPAPPAPPAGSREDGEAPLRILAAEDNPVNRKVLAALLAPFGIDLTMVENGQLAVEAWRRGGFDLVLMDIQMPQMGGIEATRHIRAFEAEHGWRPIPIIAVSANAMKHQVEEYLDVGMTGFVAKPVEPMVLYGAIEEAALAVAAGARPAPRRARKDTGRPGEGAL